MSLTRSSLGLVLILSTAGVFITGSFGQSGPLDKAKSQREGIVARAPAAAEPVDSRTPAESDAVEADRTPLGVDIHAIRLIAHQDKTDSSPAPGANAVEIDSAIRAPEGLSPALEPFLGQPVSMALLAELNKAVVEAWRDDDFPIIDVYFPEQNITGGKIQIVVREALLGKVRINDTVHTNPAYLERNIRLSPGDRIDRRILDADLDWINRNPIRQVNLVYERGDLDGTSNVALETIEEDPLTAYIGFANTGVDLTGENEWSAGFNWANPFRTEQSFGYHYGADLEFETLESHSAIYRGFLPWRHELRFLGAAVFSDVPADPGDPAGIGIGGENLQASIDYVIPLARIPGFRGLRHELGFGMDYKSTNTDLIFGGFNAIASTAEVFQFRTSYEGTWRDKWGYQFFSFGSVWSPGDVLNHNDDASFDDLRDGAGADYWYGYAELERGLKLPADFQLVLRGRGHLTNDRLLSTEQLLAGGYLTVRGFDENLVRGDSGGIVNVELISPTFSLASYLRDGSTDEWNALLFYDGAYLDIVDPLAGEVSPALQSVGLGFTCRFGEMAQLRAAYGWVLDTHGVNEDEISDGRLHFGMTVRY